MYQRERSKYGNVKTTTSDGITHDSIKEANRWCELKLLERAGKISNLQRQVEYELIPPQYEITERYSKSSGKRLKDSKKLIEKKCSYIADFVYYDNNLKKIIVEDTKGVKTKEYILKRKLLLYMFNIKIHEI